MARLFNPRAIRLVTTICATLGRSRGAVKRRPTSMGVLATILWLSTSPVCNAQSITAEARFFPAFSQGQLIGCQVGFSVLRRDEEFNRGVPVLLNGLIVFYGANASQSGVALRLGTALGSSPAEFHPVERAFLLDGMRTNADDAGNSFPSEDPGFRMFAFGLGEATSSAIGRSLTEGRFRIAYGLPDTVVDAIFDVDLGDHQEVQRQWMDCIGEVVR